MVVAFEYRVLGQAEIGDGANAVAVLGDAPDAGGEGLARAPGRGRLSGDAQLARDRRLEPRDEVRQRALAIAGDAREPEDLARTVLGALARD